MLPKGVLHAMLGGKKFSLQRYEPGGDVGYFVQHYWVVRWDLRGSPYSQTILAHPNVNLVFEKGRHRHIRCRFVHVLAFAGWPRPCVRSEVQTRRLLSILAKAGFAVVRHGYYVGRSVSGGRQPRWKPRCLPCRKTPRWFAASKRFWASVCRSAIRM